MADPRPAVVTCTLLCAEVEQALARLGEDRARLAMFPTSCHLGRTLEPHPVKVVEEVRRDCFPVVALCLNCCYGPLRQQVSEPGVALVEVGTQAELVLGADATRHLLDQGVFLVLPGWLRRWREIVEEIWAFPRDAAREFFQETARRLLVLDTGCVPVDEADVAGLAELAGLPADVRYVGTSHLELLLDRQLALARHGREQAEARQAVARARETAAHEATIVDFVTGLGQLEDEGVVVARLRETAAMLFAASSVAFEPAAAEAGAAPPREPRVLPGGAALEVPLDFGGRALGTLRVAGLAMPDNAERYLPMARALCEASALAIHAARLLARQKDLSRRLAVKVQELDAFVSIAAHDLKTPLAGVMGFAELLALRHGAALPPDARALVARISQSAGQMAALIEDLLKVSRIGRHEVAREVVSVEQVAREVRDMVLSPAGAWPLAEVTVEAPLPAVLTSRSWLREVLQNLVVNGLKYNEAPVPRVSVLAPADVPEPLREGDRDMACLAVRDNGIGIAPADAEVVFEMFRRLQRAEGVDGTGVGLAIVKRIVDEEGGRLWLQSEPGRGSTFFFTLPRAPAAG